MRLRLAHTQSLVLLTAVLFVVLSMGLLNAWNLQNGFSEYLNARDVDRLERFAEFVSSEATLEGGIEELRLKQPLLTTLLQKFLRLNPPFHDRPPIGMISNQAWPEGTIPRPPPAERANAFRERVAIYRLNGEPLYERDVSTEPSSYLERQVIVSGEPVALVRVQKLQQSQDVFAANFLRSQYDSIAFAAVALLLIAVVSAHWVSGKWIRPLLEIQSATKRIAAGNFDIRLREDRADEIGDLMRNVNHMVSDLQSLEQSRRRWIANMSHELRTPLTVLRGEVDALLDGVRVINNKAIVSIREDVAQLTSLVDDLHLLAMSDLNALPCYFEESDVIEILGKAVALFESAAVQKGLEIKLTITKDGDGCVRWDRKRVLQLISNILDNSIRYTDAPGSVCVKANLGPEVIVVCIDDSSPNVPHDDLPLVFKPLYRADTARSRNNGGSGLGLAICKAIVKAHHGSIDARFSNLGGLKIVIELPREVDNTL